MAIASIALRGRTHDGLARIALSRRTLKTSLFLALLALLTALALATALLVALMARIRPTLPSAAQIAAFRPIEATRILSSDGVLLAKLQFEDRKVVPLSSISKSLVDATLAVEDDRFYHHSGIDPKGIVRAAWANLCRREKAQGASTITQQLARNVSQFGIGREKTAARKLREAMTAVRIEQVFTKDEILELYLNQIYYGNGAYGVEAAARTYFGKKASDLSLPEAALLAGLPQRPEGYSPYSHPKAARNRRDLVLRRMRDTGRISEAQLAEALEAPVRVRPPRPRRLVYRAPYFVDWVTRELVRQYGVEAAYSGMTVVTSLNAKMQAEAERALRSGLSYGATQGALVSLDPHTGYVRAMVGGVNYQKDRFNAVTQGMRQPGSAFKTIVYAAAFDSGALDLESRLKDERIEYQLSPTKSWAARNYTGGYANRDRTILEAIAYSINSIAVEAGMQTGLDRVIAYARALGISTRLDPWPSLSLGACAVRPIELCAAYGVFAAGGDHYAPQGILEVRDPRGAVLFRDSPDRRRRATAISPSTIDQINVALRFAVTSGSGIRARGIPEAFGKTGTTSDHRDAWFVGYTPELATAVWVARPYKDGKGVVRYRVMPGATGGKAAAPIWARFMAKAVSLQKQANLARRLRYAIQLPEELLRLTRPPAGTIRIVAGPDEADPVTSGWPGPSLAQPVFGEGAVSGMVIHADMRESPLAAPSVPPPSGAFRAVALCVDSGQLATEWCSATLLVRASARTQALGLCRRHMPPAGEPGLDARVAAR